MNFSLTPKIGSLVEFEQLFVDVILFNQVLGPNVREIDHDLRFLRFLGSTTTIFQTNINC